MTDGKRLPDSRMNLQWTSTDRELRLRFRKMNNMRIGIHDAEQDFLKHKTFPNYALMKISAWHKAQGDTVQWWEPVLTDNFDRIYSSKVFDFTLENPYLPPWTIRGGLGFLASAIEDYAPYQLGQTLYVRETWCNYGELDDNDQVIDGTEQYYYRADGENPTPFNYIIENDKRRDYPIWHPSIHMPKKAARIFLRVKDVRVERLQNISGQDLSKEGICTREELCNGMTRGDFDGFAAFAQLWNRTIKKADLKTYGWDANPWVWVIEFEHIGKEGAESEKD